MNPDTATNGRRAALLADLEQHVRDAIDASFYTGERRPNGSRVSVDSDDERAVLRDYVRDQGFVDKFEALVERETTHERRHRRGAPNGWHFKFGAKHGARIIILANIGDGARLNTTPGAACFISMRDTAAEALLVGFLARAEIRKRPGLIDALDRLDYSAAGRDSKAEATP